MQTFHFWVPRPVEVSPEIAGEPRLRDHPASLGAACKRVFNHAKSDKAVRDEEVEKEQEVQSQNVKQEELLSSNNLGPGGLANWF